MRPIPLYYRNAVRLTDREVKQCRAGGVYATRRWVVWCDTDGRATLGRPSGRGHEMVRPPQTLEYVAAKF